MTILYKYFSQDFIENKDLFEGFILNPNFKLALPHKLNDPFESFVASDIKKHLAENETIHTSALSKSLSESTRDNFFDINIKLSGIVSLTETSRNKLMWAHYASDHKGVVIGFNIDTIEKSLNDDKLQCHKKRFITKRPIKINYNSVRFDLINEAPCNDVSKEMLKLMLTTKSDDWIYEKEHRFIIPLEACDIMIGHEKSYFLEDIAKTFNFKKEGEKYHIKNTFTNHLPENEGWHLNSTLTQLVDEDISFFKKIPPSSIHSIHLGVRTKPEIRSRIINFLKLKKLYECIKLYEYSLNKNYFELNAERIVLDY